jgi:hypothetical protein
LGKYKNADEPESFCLVEFFEQLTLEFELTFEEEVVLAVKLLSLDLDFLLQ